MTTATHTQVWITNSETIDRGEVVLVRNATQRFVRSWGNHIGRLIHTTPESAIARINQMKAEKIAELEQELARVRAIDAEQLVRSVK
jgi:hypothetical protein